MTDRSREIYSREDVKAFFNRPLGEPWTPIKPVNNECIFSADRKHRYTLWRVWDDTKPFCQFIGLNPSTADETVNDRTVSRCIQFAKDWGYGALCMTNLFAWRDTEPEDMKRATDPIGPENDMWLEIVSRSAGIIIAAWGIHGTHLYRAIKFRQLARTWGVKVHCLKLTDDGHPSHPLYLKGSLKPIPYDL